MGISETSAKIIGTCTISVGTNIPSHNPAISNANCKAWRGRVHLLGYVLASNRGCFRDEHCREHGNLGGVRVPGLRESAFKCERQSNLHTEDANGENPAQSGGE